jgi:hypothetical protein
MVGVSVRRILPRRHLSNAASQVTSLAMSDLLSAAGNDSGDGDAV